MEMNEIIILVPFLYIVITVSVCLFLKSDKKLYLAIYESFLIISFITLVLFLSVRSFSIDFFNVTNIFETILVMLSITTIVMLFLSRYLKQAPCFFITLGMILFLVSAFIASPLISKSLLYPKPALRSPLISIHVLSAIAGETLLFLVLCLQASSFELLLIKNSAVKKIYIILSNLGYLLFTVGALVIGPVWAKLSWGRYWSWDPKEISSFMVWIFFTIFIFIGGDSRKIIKLRFVMLVITFTLSLFTFIAIPIFSSSLHSH